MINISIKKGNEIEEIEVTGHAFQNEKGKDIVCASVSTAIYVSLNLLERLTIKVDYKLEEGYFNIQSNGNYIVNAVLQNLEFTFKDLERQFPKYIKIKL